MLPLSPLRVRPIARGSAASLAPSDDVFVLGSGGRAHALKATIIAKREFAGYWEYLLDEALFATPVHPEWSGAALVGEDGRLVGIGSLLVQEAVGDDVVKGNMFVPADLLAPILDDLLRTGLSGSAATVARHVHRGDAERTRRQRSCYRRAGGQGGHRAGRRRGRSRRRSCHGTGRHVPPDLAQGSGRRRGCADRGARRLCRCARLVQSGDRRDFLRKPRLQ